MKECPSCGKCYDDNLLRCPDDEAELFTTLEGSCLIDRKYLLLRCLGKGGMGAVYLARHVELQKNFALKLIQHSSLSDAQSLARFKNEAKALGKLQHPNIVQVTDYGVDSRNGGLPYLVMEYLRGKTLLHYLRDAGPLSFDQAVPLLESVARALDYAHQNDILHRDLNPKNIFLVQDEPSGIAVKILDFGLARIIGEPLVMKDEDVAASRDSVPPSQRPADVTRTLISDPSGKDSTRLAMEDSGSLTQAGVIMGTPGFIAPEIFRGRLAANASDIYSFGVIIYEMLVGKRPFKDPSRISQVPEPPPLPSAESPSIPQDLDLAILAPLEEEPDKRPVKAIDVVRRLQNAYAGYRYRTWRVREWPKRIGMAAALAVALVLLALVMRGLPLFKNIENDLADLRFRWLPSHPPTDSIVLVSIDEASLQADPTLLVNKAEEMGSLLQRVFDAGAKGIALDFLLPESWGQSESFARLVLNNQERFIPASYIKDDGSLLGMECLKGLIMAALGSPERAGGLFGFLNVPPDPDGRIRRVQLGFEGRTGQSLLSMPAKAYQISTGGSLARKQIEEPVRLDFSADWTMFRKISWKDLPAVIDQNPGLFRQKMVFVGGEYEGSQDFHRIPKRPGFRDEISGLLVQALAFDTLVENRTVHQVNGLLAILPLAMLFMGIAFFLLTRSRIALSGALFLLLLAGYIAISIFLFIRSRRFVPLGTPLLAALVVLTAGIFVRRRLTFLAKPSAEGRGK